MNDNALLERASSSSHISLAHQENLSILDLERRFAKHRWFFPSARKTRAEGRSAAATSAFVASLKQPLVYEDCGRSLPFSDLCKTLISTYKTCTRLHCELQMSLTRTPEANNQQFANLRQIQGIHSPFSSSLAVKYIKLLLSHTCLLYEFTLRTNEMSPRKGHLPGA